VRVNAFRSVGPKDLYVLEILGSTHRLSDIFLDGSPPLGRRCALVNSARQIQFDDRRRPRVVRHIVVEPIVGAVVEARVDIVDSCPNNVHHHVSAAATIREPN